MRKDELLASIEGLIEGVSSPLTNLANAAAALWGAMEGLNWAGFYLLDRGALWLAPFQGKPACTRIEIGRGVCGTAFARNETIIVPDVHQFPGHIACDEASRSEIVVPLRCNGAPIGVLDLDSPRCARFEYNDQILLETVVRLLETGCDWCPCGYDLKR